MNSPNDVVEMPLGSACQRHASHAAPKRVLIVHNYYRWRGGEDVQVEREIAALERSGARVQLFAMKSEEVRMWRAILNGWTGFNNLRVQRAVRRVVDEFRPDVIHIHNTFPFLTPGVIRTLEKSRAQVVITLHNYRVFCANGLCMRGGYQCMLCKTSSFPYGIVHGCYRGSRAASAFVWAVGRHLRRVLLRSDACIAAPSKFAADALGSVLGREVAVLPNIVQASPGARACAGEVVLYVGRLSAEKGVCDLLEAWSQLPARVTGSLVLVGDGDLRRSLEQYVVDEGITGVQFAGWAGSDEVAEWMRSAQLCVICSRVPETFGLVAAEAAAQGCACVVSDAGALAETLGGEDSGWVFPAGEVSALRSAISAALTQREERERRALRALQHVDKCYTERAFIDRFAALCRVSSRLCSHSCGDEGHE